MRTVVTGKEDDACGGYPSGVRGTLCDTGTCKSDEDDACGSPSGVRGMKSSDDGEVGAA